LIAEILTNEINEFVREQDEKCSKNQSINSAIMKLIEGLFLERLPDLKAQLYLYGSQSSGLCLEFSDVDLVVVVAAQGRELFDQIESAGVFKVQYLLSSAH
jgi:DNA polymerase sigma